MIYSRFFNAVLTTGTGEKKNSGNAEFLDFMSDSTMQMSTFGELRIFLRMAKGEFLIFVMLRKKSSVSDTSEKDPNFNDFQDNLDHLLKTARRRKVCYNNDIKNCMDKLAAVIIASKSVSRKSLISQFTLRTLSSICPAL